MFYKIAFFFTLLVFNASCKFECRDSSLTPALSTGYNSASSNVEIFINAIGKADLNRIDICIPNGTYYLDRPIDAHINNQFHLSLGPSVVFKATSSHQGKIFNIIGTSNCLTGENVGNVKIRGGKFDVTNIPSSDSQNRGTIFHLSDVASVDIKGVTLLASDTATSNDNRGGDSGIAIVNGNRIFIENNEIQGFSDAGIYITGGTFPYDPVAQNKYRSHAHVKNNEFVNNNIGITVKRRFPYAEIRDNEFNLNGIDVHEGETGDNHPGSSLYVIGNKSQNHSNHFVLLSHSRGTTIRDNKIYISGAYHISQKHGYSDVPIIRIRGGDNIYNDSSENKTWIHGNLIWDLRNLGLAKRAVFVKAYPFKTCVTVNGNTNVYQEGTSSYINLTRNKIMTTNAGEGKLTHIDSPMMLTSYPHGDQDCQ